MRAARPVVTVDGPAGSGKTTLGRRLAALLGLPIVDTGLFYRAVTAAAVGAGLGPDDREAIAELARGTAIVVNTDPADLTWEVRINGRDPGRVIRDARHAPLLSAISQIPEVRRHLLPLQREPASRRGAVAVGRDCGTVVFPSAVVKLYLQAAEALRAARRGAELADRGAPPDQGIIDAEIGRRDRSDAAALAPAPDATLVDTGSVGIDEMVRIALRLCADAGLIPGRDAQRAMP